MDIADWISDSRNWVFVVLALPMLFAGFRAVTSGNVVHSVLFLVVALATSAGFFLLLGAEFVAWTVILVYIGAVIVLFLFGIMITRAPLGVDINLDNDRKLPAAIVSLLVFVLLAGTTLYGFGANTVDVGVVRTEELGTLLFSRFVIPFEAVSFVLLSALIGGIVLARRDPEDSE